MSKIVQVAAIALVCSISGCAPVRYYQALAGKSVAEPEPPKIVERGQRAPSHEKVTAMSDGLYLARIRKHGEQRFGVVDRSGRVVIPIGYQYLTDLGGRGFVAIGSQSLRGFDRQGNETSTTLFERELHFRNGQAVAVVKAVVGGSSEERYGVIDTRGKTVIPFEYSGIFESSTDASPTVSWYRVRRDIAGPGEPGKIRAGLLDARGRTVLPIAYYDVSPGIDRQGLDRGWATVFEQEHEGVAVNFITGVRMHRTGGSFYGRTVGYSALLNPPPEALNQYQKMQYRKEHAERYRLELFDTQGKLVYDQSDIGATWDLRGLIAVSRTNKFALLDADGRPLTLFKYDEVKDYGGGQALMVADGKVVCIDAAHAPGTERPARECTRATTKKEGGKPKRRQRDPIAVPAVYPRYRG
ncbi:WG repeat-containing protein [Lysobacter antibioticus]|uniref:KWG Leptospira family protein n=1 Tax=Lysobacter antibioticus TaxID=84531 RepID=A0A0S2F5C2_LYSAN|nr:WG repeat-containing protein [Lysobacter antibioticus]ALN78673.1 KWG Leptospira family protein [Lysobacter antibioticus]